MKAIGYSILRFLFRWIDHWVDLVVAIIGIVTFGMVYLNWELAWRVWWGILIASYDPHTRPVEPGDFRPYTCSKCGASGQTPITIHHYGYCSERGTGER